ncbi:MAG: T9SS type A sorting domain-containing protein [Bacteroidota bacterium]
MKNLAFIISTIAIIGLSFVTYPAISQTKINNNRHTHNETPDDAYLPMLAKDKKTSPAYRHRSSSFFTTQVNIDANGDNILGDAANEPTIAVDPTNPDRIVMGWRQFDNVASNFRQAGYGYSLDGGQTWTFPGVIDAGVFRSDPVLDFDAYGNFYYNSLTKDANNNYWCNIYKIDNGGVEWDDGTYAHGGDKQWMSIDRTGGIGDGNIYASWTSGYSSCEPGFFTRSTNGGFSYEDCEHIPGYPKWGTLAVGPEGELYSVGQYSYSAIAVNKSISAKDPTMQTSWEQGTVINTLGYLDMGTPVNPDGLLGQAYIDVDNSSGPGRGNVYILASARKGDVGDVMFARSTEEITIWDEAIRINDDTLPGTYQWFGTMSVAPNGRIDAVWLDTRNAPSTNIYISELYYSYSIDQGVTWSVNEKLSEAFDPHVGWPNQNKMGDYFHMISDDNGAHLAWANTINGEQDVYYGYINPWFVGVGDKVGNDFSFINYPNPVRIKTTLRYELQQSKKINISVYNIYGNLVEVITDEIQNAGIHNIVFDACKLANGIYFCKLTAGSKTETIKLTLVN